MAPTAISTNFISNLMNVPNRIATSKGKGEGVKRGDSPGPQFYQEPGVEIKKVKGYNFQKVMSLFVPISL